MDISTLRALKGAASALGSATKHIGAATFEVGKVLLPVAGAALGNVPKAAASTLDKARSGETSEERKHAAATLGIGVAVVVGLGVATYAHFSSKFKKGRAYRQQKRQMKAAVAREREIDDVLSEAVAFRSAEDVLSGSIESDLPFVKDSGCFAIFTYDSNANPDDIDLAAYRDVYVGATTSMIAGVRKQLDGKGNLYVHADMVYKRPMQVAFYPCEESELLNLHNELVITLGADESYNKTGLAMEID